MIKFLALTVLSLPCLTFAGGYTIQCNGVNLDETIKVSQRYEDNDVIKGDEATQATLSFMASGPKELNLNKGNFLPFEHYLTLDKNGDVENFYLTVLNDGLENVLRVEYSKSNLKAAKIVAYNVDGSGKENSFSDLTSKVTCTKKNNP